MLLAWTLEVVSSRCLYSIIFWLILRFFVCFHNEGCLHRETLIVRLLIALMVEELSVEHFLLVLGFSNLQV